MGEKVIRWAGSARVLWEQAREVGVFCDLGEASFGEWRGVVGKAGGAQAGEETEGEVEGADDECGGEMHGAGGNAEVGDEPERTGAEVFRGAFDQGVEVGLGEAVEEEVSNDEIVNVLWGFEGKS